MKAATCTDTCGQVSGAPDTYAHCSSGRAHAGASDGWPNEAKGVRRRALEDAEREGDEEEGEGEGGEGVAGEIAPEDVQAGLGGRRAEGHVHQLLAGAAARQAESQIRTHCKKA